MPVSQQHPNFHASNPWVNNTSSYAGKTCFSEKIVNSGGQGGLKITTPKHFSWLHHQAKVSAHRSNLLN